MTTSPKELLAELLSDPDGANLPNDFLLRVERLFLERGDTARARWMVAEREGYGARTEPANLADVLGIDPTSEIIGAVLRSRLCHGQVVVGGVARQWPHFFVEGVDELRRWAGRVEVATIELELSADAVAPRALSFPRAVFVQVLDRIAIEIADALRALGGRA